MVAFTFRSRPRYPQAARRGEGHFGEIRTGACPTNDGLDPSLPFGWRHLRARGGAGVIADMGSHMIDAARYLLGEIVAVSAVNHTYVAERDPGGHGRVEVPEACAWVAEFASGVVGTFDVSRAVVGRGGTGRPQYQGVEIHGTGGAALYELIHPFQLQLSLGPAMARRQHWATVEVPPDFAVYPGSPRNPRADDPLVAYKYDQGVAFVRAVRGDDGLPDPSGTAPRSERGRRRRPLARERRWIRIALRPRPAH
jgi:predicted dehydrogenase